MTFFKKRRGVRCAGTGKDGADGYLLRATSSETCSALAGYHDLITCDVSNNFMGAQGTVSIFEACPVSVIQSIDSIDCLG